MKTMSDVSYENDDYLISRNKLLGGRVKDIIGYVANHFDVPNFKMTEIIMEDGTKFWCEGEHDLPYVVGLDDDMLTDLYNEVNRDDGED